MSASRITITSEDLAGLDLTDATKQYLHQHGLPQANPDTDRPFGLSFCTPFAHQIGRRRYVVFASQEWAPKLYLAIKAGTDRIVAPAGPLDRGDVYVNATISDFIDFYHRASPLWAQADEFTISMSDQMTPEELLASIRELDKQLARGEISDEPDPRRAEFTAATKQLKAHMKATDARAVRGSSWWGRAIEDFEG